MKCSSYMIDSSCSATDNCLAGMKLTVFRGESATEEAYYIATVASLKSTEGPVVAFYGLIQGTNLCLSRLGGYRLLDSSEFSSECVFPSAACPFTVVLVLWLRLFLIELSRST